MKQANRFHYGWVIVVGSSLSYMCWAVSRHLYPYILPTMETDLNLLHTSMGNVTSSYFIAYAAMTFVWGILADRIGPRKCMLIGMVIILVGLAGMGFMSSVVTGSLSYFLCGAGAAGQSIPGVRLISDWFSGVQRGKALGITMAASAAMGAVMGFVIPIILVNYSWQWSWWIAAAFVLIMAAICWFLLVNTPAQKGLGRVGSSNMAFSAQQRQHMKEKPQDIEPKATIWHVLKRGTVWNLAGIYFTYGLGYVIFMTFAVAFLKEMGWEMRPAAAVFAMWAVLQVPGYIIWGAAADRLTKKYIFAIVLALQAIGLYVFLGGNPVGCYIATAVIGFGNAGVPVTMAASVADYYESTIIATSFGFITLTFGIAAIIAPTIGGALADRTGTLSTAILFSLGAIIVSFILALVLKKPPKQQPSD